MERFRLTPFASSLGQSRRTLLGTALATAGAVSSATTAAGKKKKNRKRCKAPTTKCGKKRCCQPGQVCSDGQCQTAVTPLRPFQCLGPRDGSGSGFRRVAQTFVANGSGTIGSATFEVSDIEADMAFGVEIRTTQSGSPTSVSLGTAIIFNPPPTPPSTPITATATFAPKVPVTGGVTYALVITDLANKGFTISTRAEGVCPTDLLVDINANNQFFSFDGSLIYSISP